MWKVVVADVTTKSMLFLLDAEEQLTSMKLSDNQDSKAHLAELKQHFQLMLQCRDNLLKMGSMLSDTWFNTLIMSSLPESCWCVKPEGTVKIDTAQSFKYKDYFYYL